MISDLKVVPKEPEPTMVTLTLTGTLANAQIWNADGSAQITDPDVVSRVTDINGETTTTVTVEKGASIIVRDADIAPGSYEIDGEMVTVTTQYQLPLTLNNSYTLDGMPDAQYAITTHHGVAATWALGTENGTIAADSTEYVPAGATVTITNVGEGSKVVRDNTLGVTNPSYQYDVNNTFTANKAYDLYSASEVEINGSMEASIGDTVLGGDGWIGYVAIGVTLDVATTVDEDNFGVYASTTTDRFGKAISEYVVTEDDVYLSNGALVTLGNGVSVMDGDDTVYASGTVLSVSNGAAITGLTAGDNGTTIIAAPAGGAEWVASSVATYDDTDATWTTGVTLVAAVRVTATGNATVTYVHPVTGTPDVIADSGKSAYVLPGTELKVDKATAITGVDVELVANGAVFEAGSANIAVAG